MTHEPVTSAALGGPGLWRAAWLVARKDWAVAGRTRDSFTATVFFAGLVLLILGFALGPDEGRLRAAAPGILWSALALSSAVAAGRAFGQEQESGTLERLLGYPVAHEALYLGKFLGVLAQLLLLALVVVPACALIYGLSGPWLLIGLTVLLGLTGLAASTAFYAAITVNLRAREALLPVLAFPVLVPVVLAGVRATMLLAEGALPGEWGAWLSFLALYDAVAVVASALLFPFAVEG